MCESDSREFHCDLRVTLFQLGPTGIFLFTMEFPWKLVALHYTRKILLQKKPDRLIIATKSYICTHRRATDFWAPADIAKVTFRTYRSHVVRAVEGAEAERVAFCPTEKREGTTGYISAEGPARQRIVYRYEEARDGRGSTWKKIIAALQVYGVFVAWITIKWFMGICEGLWSMLLWNFRVDVISFFFFNWKWICIKRMILWKKICILWTINITNNLSNW